MSPDTKAIIDRLKREGDLFRNSGTNSLKSVKVELGKFSDAFTALSASMAGVKGTIQKQSKLEELRDEKQFKLEQITDEKERKKYEESEEKNLKVQQQIETDRLKEQRKSQLESQKRDLKLFGKDGLFTSALKSSFSFIKSVLFYGLVGAIGYEVIVGALEALAPDVFGEGGSIGKLPSLFESFEKVGTAFGKLEQKDWDGFVDNIKYLGQPLGTLFGGYVAVQGGKIVATKAAETLTLAAILRAMTPSGIDVDASATKAGIGKALRVGLAGAIFTGLMVAMPKITDWIRQYVQGMSPEEIALTNTDTDAASTLGVLGAASIAALFMPGGPWVKLATFIGMAAFGLAKNAIEYYADDDKVSNKVEELHGAVERSYDQLNDLLDARKDALELGADPMIIDQQIKELRKKIREQKARGLDVFKESILENQTAIDEADERRAFLLTDEGREEFRRSNSLVEDYKVKTADGFKQVYRTRTEAEIDALLMQELKDLRDTRELNQSQLDEEVKLAMSDDYKFTTQELGVVFNKDMRGSYSTRAAFRKFEDQKMADELLKMRKEQYAEFAEMNPDAPQNYDDLVFEAIKEQAQNPLNITNVLNSTPQYNSPISLNVGGSRTMNQILQAFNAGEGLGYCPFPGGASN
jgi:hypothetical protein